MLTKIKTAALSALVGFSAIAGATATAQADSIGFGFQDGDSHIRIQLRDDQRGDWRNERRWGGGYGHSPKCSPWRAESKARNMGLRRAQVVDVDWNRIVVKGRKWGDRQTLIFGRAPRSPLPCARGLLRRT